MQLARKLSLLLILGVLSCLPACAFLPEKKPHLRPLEIGNVTTSVDNARQLINEGKPAEAITAFRSLLRVEGSSLPVLNGLAVAHAELGRPDLAASFFSRALSVSPDDPATLNNIGYAALRRREIGLARRYLEMAKHVADKTSDIGEHHPEIVNNLGALERFEARRAVLTGDDAVRLQNVPGKPLALERVSASTFRLSSLQHHSGGSRSRQEVRLEPGTSLIDFSDVFNPWSETDPQIESPL